jgi:hypothetical protein
MSIISSEPTLTPVLTMTAKQQPPPSSSTSSRRPSVEQRWSWQPCFKSAHQLDCFPLLYSPVQSSSLVLLTSHSTSLVSCLLYFHYGSAPSHLPVVTSLLASLLCLVPSPSHVLSCAACLASIFHDLKRQSLNVTIREDDKSIMNSTRG